MFSFFSKNKYNLRDSTSSAKNYLKTIQLFEAAVSAAQEQRQEAVKNQMEGKRPYPASNEEIIENTFHSERSSLLKIITAHYSLGSDIDTIYSLYESVITVTRNIKNNNNFDYHFVIQTVSLALLLSKQETDIVFLQELCKKFYPSDYLLNFLLNPDNGQCIKSDLLVVPKPFSGCAQAIELSYQSPEKVMDRLSKYINTQWKKSYLFQKYESNIKNHYAGNWSFESAAIIKVLGLDDSSWEHKEFYPYEMKL